MGHCTSKLLRSGSYVDVLQSTVWTREILISRLKNRKANCVKFRRFSFEPIGEKESEHSTRISIEYVSAANKPEKVEWIVRISNTSAELQRECEIREKLLPEILELLADRSYRRAKFLLNIPETVYVDIQEYGRQIVYHLVVENISFTKQCRPPPQTIRQNGLDLSHMKVALGTLAQFHAVMLCWKKTFDDDSVLDVHPYLHRAHPFSAIQRSALLARYKQLVECVYGGQLPPRVLHKLQAVNNFSIRLEEESADILGPTGVVCLGAAEIQTLQFQYSAVPDVIPTLSGDILKSSNLTPSFTNVPVCAAISEIGNVCYSVMERDLAVWIFSMANQSIRRHYLLSLLQTYTFVLTSSLDMLEVKWEKLDVSLNNFIKRFFEQIPYAVLTSILLNIQSVTEQQIKNFASRNPANLEIKAKKSANLKNGRRKCMSVILEAGGDDQNTQTDPKGEVGELTMDKAQFLVHLLDDVHKFI